MSIQKNTLTKSEQKLELDLLNTLPVIKQNLMESQILDRKNLWMDASGLLSSLSAEDFEGKVSMRKIATLIKKSRKLSKLVKVHDSEIAGDLTFWFSGRPSERTIKKFFEEQGLL